MNTNHSLELRLVGKHQLLFWLFLLFFLPFLINAQAPLASGDCSRSILEFDGINDEVAVSIPDFSYASGTIEAWVRKDNWQDAVDDALFSNGISHISSNSFYLSFHPAVGLHFRYGAQGEGTAVYKDNTTTSSLAANSWHHVAATWHNNGVNTVLAIFLDGDSITSASMGNTVLTGPTTFGISKGASGSHYVLQGGSIADVRVWDVVRTEMEIASNKDLILTGSELGLISYWPLEDGTGLSATNLVTDGSSGTLTNMDQGSDWVEFSKVEVKVSDVLLTSGDVYNFGTTLLNESSDARTFTITNYGAETMELQGSPLTIISGANADQFSLDLTGTSSTILSGESTQFTVSFNPEISGENVASFSFSIADCEDPYIINLKGVASNMEPPIAEGNCGRNVLEFDGVDDYAAVSIPDFSASSGTIEGWVRKDNWQDAVDDAFFSNGIGHSSPNSFYITFHPSVGLHFRYGGTEEGNVAAYGDLSSTSELVPGSWHHVAATWSNDGSQTNLTTYLDGLQIATASTTSNLVINAGTSFGIGKGSSGSHYPLLGGAISEVRVWDFARSQSQIVADIGELLDGNESGLIAYWPLDDDKSTSVATNLVAGGAGAMLRNMNPDEDCVNHLIQIMVNNDLVLREGDFDFGYTAIGESSADTIFTIKNSSPRSLDLEGTPIIELMGDHSDQFSLDISTTATSLESGASTTFTVGFNPTSAGRKQSSFTITNESGCSNPYTINLTGTTAKLRYDGSFTESAANDGSVTGSLAIILIGDTFQDTDADDQLDIDTEVVVSNIPSGLTPLITLTSSTTAELTLSGNAHVHQSLDGISSIDFEFDDSAFGTLSASEVDSATGPIKTGIGIAFTVNPIHISYEGGDFVESATNNGSLDGKFNIILNGDTFNETDGTLIADTDFTLSGMPNGLTAEMAIEHNTVSGQEWSEMEIKENFNGVGIAYGNGIFVALANSGVNNVMISTNGTTWTHVAAPSASWRSLTFGNGVFMAVGDNYVMTSPDGMDWTVQSLSTNGLYSVNYCNGLFVIGCVWSSASAILTSPDGINWTSVPRVTTQNWNAAAYGEGIYVAVGSSGPTNNVITSTDGVNWSIITTPSGYWNSVTYAHGVFVAVGSNYSSASNIMTSSDGINWQLRAHGSHNLTLNDVTYGNGQFVAVANYSSSGTVVTSTDAINWVTHSITSTYSSDWRSVAYGDGLFVAVQDGYKVVMVSGSRASLSFTGQALDHQVSDNLSDLQIDFASSAFTASNASDVLNASSASMGAGILFNDKDGTITFGGSGFVETVANEGSVSESISLTLTGDTFQDVDADNLLDIGTEVFLPNLPQGFTPIITLNSTTEAVLTLSGNAKSHQDDDDIEDSKIVFDNSAFTSSQASAIANATGPASSGFGIDFSDNTAGIYYFGTGFAESSLNDGSVLGSLTIVLTGDTFQDPNSNNQLEPGSEIVISDLPDGLTPLISLVSTDTAVVTLTGNALSHSYSDAAEALSVAFLDAAFTSNTAAAVANATGPHMPAGFRIDFEDNATLSYSGSGFVESEDNDGSLVGSIVMNLSNASFQDDDLDSLLDVGPEVLINTVPSGMNPLHKIDSNAFSGAYWESTSVEALGWQAITYGRGMFVAVATSSNKILTSTDGINWTIRPTIPNASDWYDVTYGNGLFVAVGGGNICQVMTSPDGINWTARTAAEANYWYSVTYGNGLFVAVSNNGTNRVMTSPDGITWTANMAAEAKSWQSITYGNGLFVALSYLSFSTTDAIMTSPDGVNWTLRHSQGVRGLRDVVYADGKFVVVAGRGTTSFSIDRVLNSVDGVNWTVHDAAETNDWRAVTYANGQYVAVASSGTNRVMTSPDGENWAISDVIEENTWSSITYGNGKVVAVSSNGTNRLMTSSRSAKATLTLSGKASHHQSSNSLSDVTFDFDNSAFSAVSASWVANATGPASSGLGISFEDNFNYSCIDAQELSVFEQGVGAFTEGTTESATIFEGTLDCAEDGTVNDVWYHFTTTTTGSVEISLNLETAEYLSGAVYFGCGTDAFYCIPNLPSRLFLPAGPGLDIYMQLWNSTDDAGSFSIRVNEAPNTWAYLGFNASWTAGTAPTSEDDALLLSPYYTAEEGSLEVADLMLVNDGSIYAGSLTVNNDDTVIVNGDLVNYGGIYVRSGASLITNGAVTSVDYATFEIDEEWYFTGTIIERNTTFDNSTGRYSIVGSPVENGSFDSLGTGAVVYAYDESAPYNPSGNQGLNRFRTPSQLELPGMEPGIGYFSAFTGDENGQVVFTGTPNHGTVYVDLSYTDQGSVEEEDFEGFNLVSNPYPAAISVELFFDGNSTVGMDAAVYIWDDYGSDTGRGTNVDYIVVNDLGNTSTNSRADGEERFDGNIRSVQGFFVKANSSGQTLQFTDAMKVTGNNSDTGYFRKTSVTKYKIGLSNEQETKATIVGYVSDATLDRDRDYDALHMAGSDLQLYTKIENGEKLAIQGVPESYAGEVSIGFSTNQNTTHTISLINQSEVNQPVWLLDSYTGKSVDLTLEPYTFSTESGVFEDRFALKSSTVLHSDESVIQVYTFEKTLYINSKSDSPVEYRLFNLSGKRMESIIADGKIQVNLSHMPSGVYLISNGIESKKIVLK